MAGPISAAYRLGNTAPKERQSSGDSLETECDLTGRGMELKTFCAHSDIYCAIHLLLTFQLYFDIPLLRVYFRITRKPLKRYKQFVFELPASHLQLNDGKSRSILFPKTQWKTCRTIRHNVPIMPRIKQESSGFLL